MRVAIVADPVSGSARSLQMRGVTPGLAPGFKVQGGSCTILAETEDGSVVHPGLHAEVQRPVFGSKAAHPHISCMMLDLAFPQSSFGKVEAGACSF